MIENCGAWVLLSSLTPVDTCSSTKHNIKVIVEGPLVQCLELVMA